MAAKTSSKAKKPGKPKKAAKKMSPAAYERHKRRMADRMRAQSAASRDVKPLIDEAAKHINWERRNRALASMAAWYEYFPDRFSLPFSRDGIAVRDRLEDCINNGGLFPVLMPRGSGKTSQVIAATMYAIYSGKHPFVIPIGANAKKAKNLLRSIKSEIRSNALLAQDFPEICVPINEIAGSPNRCTGQTYDGKSTNIAWGTFEITLPAIPGLACSNFHIVCASIRSSDLRGQEFTRPCDGAVVRPTLVLPDDIQDEKIARNPQRVIETIDLLEGAVEGMAGPNKAIAVIPLLTVIERNDVADTLADRTKSPRWSGQKFKMLYRFPDNMKLWEEYGRLRMDSLRDGGKGEEATAFYAAHRAEMNAGADVAWAERFKPGELSGLQYAMNIFLDKPDVFWREYQNEPRVREELRDQLTRDDVVARVNNLDRGTAPRWTNHLTAYIDVQGSLLYYLVAAWADDFTGSVVDYGSWPEQGRAYWTLEDASVRFADRFPGAGLEGSIRQALEACVGQLRQRTWLRDGGGLVTLDKIGVDTGFQGDTVCEWARSTTHRDVILPTRGRGIGAKKRPLSEYTKRDPRERYGFHWRLNVSDRQGLRILEIDTNFWKSFVAARLRQKAGDGGVVGDRGALSLFGKAGTDHRMLADHWCAEYCSPMTDELSGRTVEEWDARPPGNMDNHLWDAVNGCAALASFLGATLGGFAAAAPQAERKAAAGAAEAARKRLEFQRARGY